jgi:hypothetical protein
MTDEEILTPGLLTFPNGGEINVHSHDCRRMGDAAQVYYALRMKKTAEWTLLRSPIAMFLVGVRTASGTRAPATSADDGGAHD